MECGTNPYFNVCDTDKSGTITPGDRIELFSPVSSSTIYQYQVPAALAATEKIPAPSGDIVNAFRDLGLDWKDLHNAPIQGVSLYAAEVGDLYSRANDPGDRWRRVQQDLETLADKTRFTPYAYRARVDELYLLGQLKEVEAQLADKELSLFSLESLKEAVEAHHPVPRLKPRLQKLQDGVVQLLQNNLIPNMPTRTPDFINTSESLLHKLDHVAAISTLAGLSTQPLLPLYQELGRRLEARADAICDYLKEQVRTQPYLTYAPYLSAYEHALERLSKAQIDTATARLPIFQEACKLELAYVHSLRDAHNEEPFHDSRTYRIVALQHAMTERGAFDVDSSESEVLAADLIDALLESNSSDTRALAQAAADAGIVLSKSGVPVLAERIKKAVDALTLNLDFWEGRLGGKPAQDALSAYSFNELFRLLNELASLSAIRSRIGGSPATDVYHRAELRAGYDRAYAFATRADTIGAVLQENAQELYRSLGYPEFYAQQKSGLEYLETLKLTYSSLLKRCAGKARPVQDVTAAIARFHTRVDAVIVHLQALRAAAQVVHNDPTNAAAKQTAIAEAKRTAEAAGLTNLSFVETLSKP